MEFTPSQKLKKSLEQYFQAEKKGGLFLCLWGLIAGASGVYLFMKMDAPLHQGIAYPLVFISLFHATVGGIVFFRTPRQVNVLLEGLRMFPKEMLASELERMRQVMANFERYKTVEMLLFFLGFAFLLGGTFGGFGDFMMGTGIGLSLQGAISLVFDLFAAFRGTFYQKALEKFERSFR